MAVRHRLALTTDRTEKPDTSLRTGERLLYDGSHMGSDFLFAMPSALSGVSRTLDLGGTFDSYNGSANGLAADTKALVADWQAVGESFVRAIEVFDKDEPKGAPRALKRVQA